MNKKRMNLFRNNSSLRWRRWHRKSKLSCTRRPHSRREQRRPAATS